jgi:hypothetical protein
MTTYAEADPRKLADWQIAEIAEEAMPTPDQWREKLGLQKDEIIPMGKLCKLDFMKIIDRLKARPDGKYVEVTAITPTPLGEGKSTTSLGLIIGANMHSQEGFALVTNFVMWPMFFFSGALFPVSQLPAYFETLSLVNPITYAVDALRMIILGQSLFPIYLDMGVLVLASIVAGIGGIISFGYLQQAK